MKKVKRKKSRIRYDRVAIFVIIVLICMTLLVVGGYFAFQMMNKVKDCEPPVINLQQKDYYLFEGSQFTIDDIHYEVSDDFDKEIATKVKMDAVDTSKIGNGTTNLSVSDQTGKMTSVQIHYEVLPLSKERSALKEEMVEIMNDCNDITVLINKTHYIPEEYVPEDLIKIDAVGHTLRKEAADAYLKMLEQAQLDGHYFFVVSATRTKEYQQELYENYVKEDSEKAFTYSALQRTSEHEIGLAIDISVDGSLDENLQDTTVGKWLAEHAHEYGYILRYPKDKSEETGYMYEPWHYRYVGVTLATKLKENNMSLEAYYQNN